MRCKDIERLIIDSSEGDLGQEELLAIEQHVAECVQCARFQSDLKNIQHSLVKIPVPVLSAELESQIRLMCYAEMSKRQAPDMEITPHTHYVSVPKFIWAALISLIALTVVLLIPLLKESRLDQPLSFGTAGVLTLIMQNTVMLIFAPIVIHKYRSKKLSFRLF